MGKLRFKWEVGKIIPFENVVLDETGVWSIEHPCSSLRDLRIAFNIDSFHFLQPILSLL
jgi:hypothetical protein